MSKKVVDTGHDPSEVWTFPERLQQMSTPPEILHRIFEFLPFQSVKELQCVDKHWFASTKEEFLKRSILNVKCDRSEQQSRSRKGMSSEYLKTEGFIARLANAMNVRVEFSTTMPKFPSSLCHFNHLLQEIITSFGYYVPELKSRRAGLKGRILDLSFLKELPQLKVLKIHARSNMIVLKLDGDELNDSDIREFDSLHLEEVQI